MAGLSAEVEGLSFSVSGSDGPQVISDMPKLEIQLGEMTALAGPSGSGKSTLLYLLAGLLVPQKGAVRWDGKDIARLSESARDRWRLDHAGFIFQSFNLVDELSPLENVLLPVRFRSFGAADWRDKARALLDRFGVPENRAHTALLSRGEQQRVAIARALLLNPKVIFADEPTASLDAGAGQFVVETLSDQAASGKTVVVASHDPALLARANRVVTLDHGRGNSRPAVMAA